MSKYLAPGVYGNVTNLSQITALASGSTGGIVLQANQGPKGMYYATQVKRLLNRYGNPDSGRAKALWAAMAMIKAGGPVWVNNVSHGDDTTAYVAFTSEDATLQTPLFDPTAHEFAEGELFIIYAAGPGEFYSTKGVRVSSVAEDGKTFTLQVVDSANTNVPLETFTVSLDKRTTPGGTQTFIENVVNSQSQYIRAMVNPELTGLMNGTISYGQSGATLTGVVVDPTPDVPGINDAEWEGIIQAITPAPNDLIYLSGGTLGSLLTNADVINGWDEMRKVNKYNVNVLLNGGYATLEVHQAMISVARERGDAWAVLDAPPDVRTPEALVAYRKTLPYERWGSLYAPEYTIYSPYTDENVNVPASGAVGAVTAYSDFTKDVWWAPAGPNRGKVPDAIGLPVEFEQEDIELMYPESVNNIVNQDGIGIAVWGQRTLLQDDSSLWSVNVHRLLCVLMKSMASYLKYSLFEQNDEITREAITATLNQFLEKVKNRRGLYRYKVVCDDSNNTPQDIDELTLNVDVYLQPTRAAEFIALNSILTRTGASFETTTGVEASF